MDIIRKQMWFPFWVSMLFCMVSEGKEGLHLTGGIIMKLYNNDIITYPFMGSGTTGIACVNTKRNFIGIELEKKYFDIAKDRIKEAVENKKVE